MTQNSYSETDRQYMRRALQLAARGEGNTSPNPMVGAVIVADGRIIGEGYHRKYGGPHAEVNAINSVAENDRHLLGEATIYVTLEPCSHFGKTPPCAQLLAAVGFRRVVVGSRDPFPQVSGRGIEILRHAGIEVTEGVLRRQCEELNAKFMTAHTKGRPFITLKWARTANGYIGTRDIQGRPAPVQVSNPLTQRLTHRQRALHDAILVGMGTVLSDNPRLDTRLWPGRSPRIVILTSHGEVPPESAVMQNENALIYNTSEMSIAEIVKDLYASHGITSLLVEGGAVTLQRFIDAGLYDAIRRETSPSTIQQGVPEPVMPQGVTLSRSVSVEGNIIEWFAR